MAPLAKALQALRGVGLVVAATLATEIGDLSRFRTPKPLEENPIFAMKRAGVDTGFTDSSCSWAPHAWCVRAEPINQSAKRLTHLRDWEE